jgi:hypothetical protein
MSTQYTTFLYLIASFFLMPALSISVLLLVEPESAEARDPFSIFILLVSAALAVFCLATAILRSTGHRSARAATEILSWVLFLAFPIGTLSSTIWLLFVRGREPLESYAESIRSTQFRLSYTVLLSVMGLGFGSTLAIEALVEPGLLGNSLILRSLLRCMFILMMVLCSSAAIARMAASRLARLLTTIASVGLAIIFPIGTVCFLYWLARIRPLEKPPENSVVSGDGL